MAKEAGGGANAGGARYVVSMSNLLNVGTRNSGARMGGGLGVVNELGEGVVNELRFQRVAIRCQRVGRESA